MWEKVKLLRSNILMMGTVTAEVRNVLHGLDETPAMVGIC